MPEARLEDFGSGLTPVTQGWFVVNVRDAEWWFSEKRGARCAFENEYGDPPVEFDQLGINVTILEPGDTSLYHAEANQEAFLVLSGECGLLVENEERRLRSWDFFHAPPWTEHAFVGAGEGPCVILMVGSRSGPGVHYPCRSSRQATAQAWPRRPPTGGRRTRRSSGSGESGRRTGLVCPGRKIPSGVIREHSRRRRSPRPLSAPHEYARLGRVVVLEKLSVADVPALIEITTASPARRRSRCQSPALGVNAALRVPGRDRLLAVCHRRRAARARRDWCGTARRAGSHARQQHQHGQQHEFHANPFSPRPSFDGVSPLISF